MSSASKDESRVPYTNGIAPKCSATGSQVEDAKNRQPKVRIAGHDACNIDPIMATTSRTSVSAAARMTKRRTWSPMFLGAACASTR